MQEEPGGAEGRAALFGFGHAVDISSNNFIWFLHNLLVLGSERLLLCMTPS